MKGACMITQNVVGVYQHQPLKLEFDKKMSWNIKLWCPINSHMKIKIFWAFHIRLTLVHLRDYHGYHLVRWQKDPEHGIWCPWISRKTYFPPFFKNTLTSSSKRPLCDLHQVCLCASSRDDVTMIPFICMGGYSFKNMHINLTFKDKSWPY